MCDKGKDVALADGTAEAYLLGFSHNAPLLFFEHTAGNVP